MGKRSEKNTNSTGSGGITRRGFFSSVGAGAVVATAAGTLVKAEEKTDLAADETMEIVLIINGHKKKVHVEPRYTLLYVIRDMLGMTATKIGCERGECGACTVLIDDIPRYACKTLAVEAVGRKITTLEGLMDGEELGPVQKAFQEHDGFQCGFCTTGQIMAVEGLLRANPDPDIEEIRLGVSGNLCRCGTYKHIYNSAQRAAELKKGGAQ